MTRQRSSQTEVRTLKENKGATLIVLNNRKLFSSLKNIYRKATYKGTSHCWEQSQCSVTPFGRKGTQSKRLEKRVEQIMRNPPPLISSLEICDGRTGGPRRWGRNARGKRTAEGQTWSWVWDSSLGVLSVATDVSWPSWGDAREKEKNRQDVGRNSTSFTQERLSLFANLEVIHPWNSIFNKSWSKNSIFTLGPLSTPFWHSRHWGAPYPHSTHNVKH